MAKTNETTQLKAAEALRNGWLAYLGLYGAAYERVKPLTEKYADVFGDLIAKGETIEAGAQERVETVRTRAQGIYAERLEDRIEKVRGFMPKFPVPARKARIEELEAEIEALNKKVAALTKKPATKKATKKAA